MNETAHIPVMLPEVVELLEVKPGGTYIDATLGGGGYTAEILKRSAPGGRVLALDLNEQAIADARVRFGPRSITYKRRKPSFTRSRSESASLADVRLVLEQGNFRRVADIAHSHNITRTDGVVFDLGLSSDLLERSGRGFSYQKSEPLLMTFSQGAEQTAADVVNTCSKKELAQIFRTYGDIRQAENIAGAIVATRKKKAFKTTDDLRNAVARAVKSTTPALLAKVWQALRITVNDEIMALQEGLAGAWELIGERGVVAVVSFHSLEDWEVKHFFRDKEKDEVAHILTPKPLRPTKAEVARNPRARSARLRAAQKI